MNKTNIKNTLIILGLLLILEIISMLGFSFPLVNQIAFLALIVLTVAISIWRLEYGLMIVLAELIIGSKGYLFYLSLGEGRLLSLRLAIWSIFMLIFVIKFSLQLKRDGDRSDYFQRIKNFIFLKPFLILAGFIIIGLISAFLYQNSLINIFLDFNAWLYFLILFPIITVRVKREKLIGIFIAGAILVSLKTLILLIIFSGNFSFAPQIYSWLRKTLVGEMTATGGWNRVFIQSQIFSAIAYLFLFFRLVKIGSLKELFNKHNILSLFLAALFFSTLLISLSRSFWLGFAVDIFLSVIFIWRFYSFKKASLMSLWALVSFILAIAMILAATPRLAGNLDNQIIGRVGDKKEAALVSRWLLLPEIIKEIRQNPISGQGFGATVTYTSRDPRILENEASGLYTTYAFEWGYLDIWLKIGFLGLIAYLFLMYKIIYTNIVAGLKSDGEIYLGIAASCLFLAIVNIFTPYLNHPLGIGFITASSCLIIKDRVY